MATDSIVHPQSIAFAIAIDWVPLMLASAILLLLLYRRDEAPPAQVPRPEATPLPSPVRKSPETLSAISKERLAHSVSHELRTPLNAVIGFSDLMSGEAFGNLGHPKYQEYCAHIRASSQNLLRTVNDIIALNETAIGDPLTTKPHNIRRALDDAWMEGEYGRGIAKLRLRVIGDKHTCAMADPDALGHAMRNVFQSLARITRPGSTITVVIRRSTERTRLHCFADIDKTSIIETAPLVGRRSGGFPDPSDQLHETVARRLIERMDGRLIRRHRRDEDRMEIICELPSVSTDGNSETLAA